MSDTILTVNSKPITIKGNCVITNYKPNEKRPQQFIFADIKDGKTNISQSSGNNQSLELTSEQYSIFAKIAAASNKDGANELSMYDIIDSGENKDNFGLDNKSYDVKRDSEAGIISVYKKVGNELKTILRIDFETQKEKPTTNQNQTNRTQGKPSKYVSLKFSRYELGQRCYSNKLNIAPNTLIETGAGTFLVDEEGQALKLNKNGDWENCTSLERVSIVASKGIASLADNTGEKNGDLTLDEKDFNIANKMSEKDLKSDLIDRFNYYDGKPVYHVESLDLDDDDCYGNKIKEKNITIRMGSNVFNDMETVNITFNVDSKSVKKQKSYTGGEENAKKIYDQIHGPSLNSNTYKLINSLSDKELVAAIKVYNNKEIQIGTKTESTDGYIYSYDGGYRSATVEVPEYNEYGMFKDLNDEWGIGIREIWPIICRATRGLSEFHRSTPEYKELFKLLEQVDGNSDKNFDDNTIISIDNAFAKVLK